MRFSNVIPKNAVNSTISRTRFVLTKKIGRQICKVKDVLSLLSEGIIRPDFCNRGGTMFNGKLVATISAKTVAKIRENLLPMSLGDFNVTIDGDFFSLTDSHGRSQGLLCRYWEGKMTEEDMNAEACIHVKPTAYHQLDYQTINDHDAHSAKQKILHPRYFYGNFFYNVLIPKLSNPAKEWFYKNFKKATILVNIIYALEQGWRDTADWDLPEIYNKRGDAAKLRDKQKGITIKEQDVNDLAAAIEGWYDLLLKIKVEVGTKIKTNDITGNPLFGFYIVDFLRPEEKKLLSKNAVLAKQIDRQIFALKNLCPILTTGKKSLGTTNCNKLIKLLKKKVRKNDD